jgi:NAD(P)-dependent dehydrogenase (short-subunit alcohol dehydrogenase family)
MEEFNRVMDINVIGTFNVLRRACHLMADNQPDTTTGQRGVIINTSSTAAYEGQIGLILFNNLKKIFIFL